MALISDSTEFSFGLTNWMGKVQRAVGHFFSPPDHSPEQALLIGPVRDARLLPRVPMHNSELDAGLLAQLSSAGLKRGKQVTAESHPELMQAWNAMSQRAGLPVPPQLILAESNSLNALTVDRNEVVVTTALLRTLDLRETVAVLGHELGHVQNDHSTPRLFWTNTLGIAGGVAGNQFGRMGGANTLLHKMGERVPFIEKARAWIYPSHYTQKASSMLGYAAYIGLGFGAGAMLGRHLSVRPTELDADRKGAAISGDPEGLAIALDKLQEHIPQQHFKRMQSRLKSGYPSMEERTSTLRSLAASGQYTPVMNDIEHAAVPVAAAPMEAAVPAMAVQGVASAGRVAEPSELGLA